MREEAEKNAAADKEAREKIDAKNRADTLIYQAEKALKDAGEKAPAEIKKEVEDKIKALKDVLESGSKADLDAKADDLQQTMMKLGPSMSQPPGGAPDAGSAAPAGDAGTGAQNPGDKKVEEGEVVG